MENLIRVIGISPYKGDILHILFNFVAVEQNFIKIMLNKFPTIMVGSGYFYIVSQSYSLERDLNDLKALIWISYQSYLLKNKVLAN